MARKAAKKRTTKKRSTRKAASKKRKTAQKKTTRKKTTKKKATKKKSTKKRAATKKAATKSAAPKAVAAPKQEKVAKVRKVTKPKNSRTNAYTQGEFLENVRAYCGFKKRSDAKELCEDISAFMMDALKKGYRIPLMGLGKMYVRKTKARMGRNPATGELIHIPAKKRVRFSVAKSLKEAVL